jgi:hypothetical protein
LTDTQRKLEAADIGSTVRDLNKDLDQQGQLAESAAAAFDKIVEASASVAAAPFPWLGRNLPQILGGPGAQAGIDPAISQLMEDLRPKLADLAKGINLEDIPATEDLIAKIRTMIGQLHDAAPAVLELDTSLGAVAKNLQNMSKALDDATERQRLLGKGAADAAKTSQEAAKILGENVTFLNELASNARRMLGRDTQNILRDNDRFIAELTENQRRANDRITKEQARALEQEVHNILSDNDRFIAELTANQKRANDQIAREQEQRVKRILQQNDQALDAAARDNQRRATELAKPFEDASQSIKGSFTDAFEEIFSGGEVTFQDLADSIKQIFARLAAELTTQAIFGQIAGGTGATGTGIGGLLQSLFGAQAAPGQAAGTGREPGGGPGGMMPPVAGAAPGTTGGASLAQVLGFGGTASATGTLGAGLLGAVGGAGFGGQIGGGGTNAQIGGALGGGLGAAAGFALTGGNPIGGLVGGILGGVAGGAIGGLFDQGGRAERHKESVTGALGELRGSGKTAKFLKGYDQAILDALTDRQEAIADKAIKNLKISGFFIDFTQGTANTLASRRLKPIAQALGIGRPEAVVGTGSFTPERQLQNLIDALNIKEQIRDVTHAVSPFQRQLEELVKQFDDLRDGAEKYGLSVKGLWTAQKEQTEALKQQAREERNRQALGLQAGFTSLSDPLRAFQTQIGLGIQSPASQFAALQKDFERIAKEAQAGSLTAISQLQGAGQALIGASGAFGASPAIVQATQQVSSVLDKVLTNLDEAQRVATSGITTVIKAASDAQIDTLQELINATKEQTAEMKKAFKGLTLVRQA